MDPDSICSQMSHPDMDPDPSKTDRIYNTNLYHLCLNYLSPRLSYRFLSIFPFSPSLFFCPHSFPLLTLSLLSLLQFSFHLCYLPYYLDLHYPYLNYSSYYYPSQYYPYIYILFHIVPPNRNPVSAANMAQITFFLQKQ